MQRYLSNAHSLDYEASVARVNELFHQFSQPEPSVVPHLGSSEMTDFIAILTNLHGQTIRDRELKQTEKLRRANVDTLDVSSDFSVAGRSSAPTPLKRKPVAAKTPPKKTNKKEAALANTKLLTMSDAPMDRSKQRLFSIKHLDHAISVDPQWKTNFVYIGATGERDGHQFVETEFSIPASFWKDPHDPKVSVPRRQAVARFISWLNSSGCTLDFSLLVDKRLLCSCPNVYSTSDKDLCHGKILLEKARDIEKKRPVIEEDFFELN